MAILPLSPYSPQSHVKKKKSSCFRFQHDPSPQNIITWNHGSAPSRPHLAGPEKAPKPAAAEAEGSFFRLAGLFSSWGKSCGTRGTWRFSPPGGLVGCWCVKRGGLFGYSQEVLLVFLFLKIRFVCQRHFANNRRKL